MTLDTWLGEDPTDIHLPPMGQAAHPPGTPARAAADLRHMRAAQRGLQAREEVRQNLLRRLRAWLRVYPNDQHARDLARVWATPRPSWRPCETDTPRWREERDAILAAQ